VYFYGVVGRTPRARTAPEPRAPTRATRVRDADARAVMSADASTRRFKIYTKTGDAGTSSLYNCERRDKDDAAFDALGDVDECNVACGIAREFCVDENNGLEAQVRRRRRRTRGERARRRRAASDD
jgi:hypothetical protein